MRDEQKLRGEIEPYIDTLYKTSPLIEIPRDTTVIHLLRTFEDSIRLGSYRSFLAGDEVQLHLGMRFSNEGLPWSLVWLWRECPVVHGSSLDLNWDLYGEASKLLALGSKYDQLNRCFTLFSRGIFDFETPLGKDEVRFFFKSDSDELRDEARLLYSMRQDLPQLSTELLEFQRKSDPIIHEVLPTYLNRTGE